MLAPAAAAARGSHVHTVEVAAGRSGVDLHLCMSLQLAVSMPPPLVSCNIIIIVPRPPCIQPPMTLARIHSRHHQLRASGWCCIMAVGIQIEWKVPAVLGHTVDLHALLRAVVARAKAAGNGLLARPAPACREHIVATLAGQQLLTTAERFRARQKAWPTVAWACAPLQHPAAARSRSSLHRHARKLHNCVAVACRG